MLLICGASTIAHQTLTESKHKLNFGKLKMKIFSMEFLIQKIRCEHPKEDKVPTMSTGWDLISLSLKPRDLCIQKGMA